MFKLKLARLALSFSTHRGPAWGPSVTRGLSGAVALTGGVCVLLAAVALGERQADRAIRFREQLVASDLVESVERILRHVQSSQREPLDRLAGQPCESAAKRLAEFKTYVRYVRGVNLVANGRLYCSSALGPMDVPLSAYMSTVQREQGISLIHGTPYQPAVPVLPVFVPTGHDTGLLYVIEGSYVTDILAHGLRYGADKVTLSVTGSGAIDEHGVFSAAGATVVPRSGTQVASTVFPLRVAVTASTAFASQMDWKYGAIFGGIGLLLAALIAAAYLLAFAPRRLLLSAVRQGLRSGQLYMLYQPVVDIATRRIVGAEALVRWTHPRWGPISPAVFMAEVESSSLLGDVTRFVLQRATDDARSSTGSAPFRIAVNVAPMDLERKGFMPEVLALVEGLPKNTVLVLEVTERFLLSRNPRVRTIFETLREHGVRFALDDFGTEHSNLDLLGRFPFDYVKIDKQFVEQVDRGGASLIGGIAAVAAHYGMQVIAEGVETEAQHDALRRLGIPFGQGYLYERPISAAKVFGAQPAKAFVVESAP
ncbi:EAL domain-containing protein [Paraburkholderia sp. BCC1884]|uniref:EAL domain-containing protein n=1 Tax=Paraburkholderia sp. BCC1884 TaxID=2562668 RepID=UPI00391F80E9